MDNITAVMPWVFAAGSLGVVLVMLLVLQRNLTLQSKVRGLEQRLIEQGDLFHAHTTTMKGMEQRLKQVKSELQQVQSRLQRAEQAVPEQTTPPVYRQAINLAMEGHNAKELSERFGLSRGEADLLVSFHQIGSQAA